jgi:hypothetical protein
VRQRFNLAAALLAAVLLAAITASATDTRATRSAGASEKPTTSQAPQTPAQTPSPPPSPAPTHAGYAGSDTYDFALDPSVVDGIVQPSSLVLGYVYRPYTTHSGVIGLLYAW